MTGAYRDTLYELWLHDPAHQESVEEREVRLTAMELDAALRCDEDREESANG